MEQWPGEKNGTAYQAVMWLFSALLRFFNKSFIYFSSVRSLINWQHFSGLPAAVLRGKFQRAFSSISMPAANCFQGLSLRISIIIRQNTSFSAPGLSGALPKKSEPQPNNLNFCWKKLEICYLCHPLKSG
jgi:hypothetical protein